MPLIVKIKNPKGGKVSITSVNGDGGLDRHIYVKIRLPKSKLEKLDGESDLSSLEDELNQVLTAQDVENMAHRFQTPTKIPQLPPALNGHGSNDEDSFPTPRFNVTLTYSPQKLSQSNDNSPLSSSGSKVSDVTKITQPDMQPLTYNKIPVLVTGDDKLDNDDHHQVTVKNEIISQTSDKPATKEEVTNPNATTEEAGFRNIPPNLMTMLKREFELLNGTEEEIEMIDKIIFTLRDPLSASKIKLPIKSINCSHFECFDFENFCEFNKVPMGIRNVLKKDLISKANELKKQDKLQQGNGKEFSHNKHINMIQLTKNFMYNPPVSEFKRNFGGFAPHYPTYKCPVCNVAFELNQLFISDIFNYFIKTSPMDIDRIELIDMSKYRIVDNAPRPQKKTVTQEVVLLESEDESDERDSIDNQDKSSGNDINHNDNQNDNHNDNQNTNQNTNQNNNNNDTNDANSTNNDFNIHINPIFQSFDDPNPKRLPSIAEIMRKVNANNTQNSVKSSTEIPGFSSDETEEEDYGMVPPPPRHYKNLDPFDDDEFDSLLDRPTFVNSPYKGSGSWEDPVTID